MTRLLSSPLLPDGAPVPATHKARWSVVAVLLLSFAWMAATGWLRPLSLPDEGRYAGVALEMLRSGHWSVPTLAGLPFFHKPPLLYWLTDAALWAFGETQWAARMGSLVGGMLGVAAVHLLACRWASERIARLAVLVLVTQPMWFIGSQYTNMDTLVAGCISATIVLLTHAALRMHGGGPWRRALLGAYVFAALGVLAKGLIGVVIPALVVLVWLALLRRWRVLFALLWLPGIALFALVAAPWFVAMQNQFPSFWHYFFVVQHFERFAQSGFNNAEPAWFYPVLLSLLSLPWLGWLVAAVRRGGYGRRVTQQPVLLLMWVWLAVVVVFFSLPQSKLVGYVLPAVPPLAYLMAEAAAAGSLRWLRATAALAGAVCLGVVVAVVVFPLPSHRNLARLMEAQRRPGEPVVFIGDYYYDVGFYADTTTPPLVVDGWSSAEVLKHDNWRRELADSASFAPAAAASRLIDDAALPGRLCLARVGWVFARTTTAARYPFLKDATPVGRENESTLWRVDTAVPAVASSLGCR